MVRIDIRRGGDFEGKETSVRFVERRIRNWLIADIYVHEVLIFNQAESYQWLSN